MSTQCTFASKSPINAHGLQTGQRLMFCFSNKFFGHTDVTLAARKATSQDQDLIIYQVGAVPKVEIFLKED